MNLTLLKAFFVGFPQSRSVMLSLYFVFLPVILLAYMALTQAVKGFYIRKFGWQ